MENIVFKDCEYRFTENNELYCKNKTGSDKNCDNFSPKKDYCLKFFKENISEVTECQEKTVFNDKELSRKWSN